MNKMEEGMSLTGRVKYVEELGSTLQEILCNQDPWKNNCGRPKCFPCRSQEGKCHAKGVVYSITCTHCKAEGRKVQYFGESARAAYDRGAEHLSALNSEDEKSPLVQHWLEAHRDKEWAFVMKVISTHRMPLSRQVEEGHRISSF